MDECLVVSAVQASNFLRAFRTLREALTLGLLLNEEEEDKADLSKLIQKWNTFVLQELHMVCMYLADTSHVTVCYMTSHGGFHCSIVV